MGEEVVQVNFLNSQSACFVPHPLELGSDQSMLLFLFVTQGESRIGDRRFDQVLGVGIEFCVAFTPFYPLVRELGEANAAAVVANLMSQHGSGIGNDFVNRVRSRIPS